jgi:hypothetical protein
MHGAAPHGAFWAPLLVALPIIALVVWRNMRGRRLRVETMWVRPAILVVLAVLVLSESGPPRTLTVVLMAVAAAAGAGLGWMRGRLMRISVDPDTHLASVQASPVAILFLVALMAVRLGARAALARTAPSLHIDVATITDVLLAMAIGLVIAQQCEMWLRCRRLIAESKAARAAD